MRFSEGFPPGLLSQHLVQDGLGVGRAETLHVRATGPRDAGHDPVDLVHGRGPREQGFA